MCLCIVFDVLYIVHKRNKKYLLGLIDKTIAVLCFIIIAYMAYKNNSSSFNYAILFVLILDGVGDLFLALRNLMLKSTMFFIGAISFLAGHILYLKTLFPINNIYRIECVIAGVMFGSIVYVIMEKACKFPKALNYIGVIYCIMILLTASFTVGIYLTAQSISNLVMMIGTLLFVSSDCILMLDNFSKGSYWMHPVYSILYFLAQIFISYSLHL